MNRPPCRRGSKLLSGSKPPSVADRHQVLPSSVASWGHGAMMRKYGARVLDAGSIQDGGERGWVVSKQPTAGPRVPLLGPESRGAEVRLVCAK